MGSLFDGIGGFPLAAIHNGVTPIWASEIEAFPIEVTKTRFPSMAHVGDITKLDGAKLPPVDILCGGSPCQDLSIAGQRAGLAGERSGLFMEQVRIAKEMRKADEQRGMSAHLIRPRFFVWENVPGAFSSADGEDFRAVLEEIIQIKDSTCHVPRPESGHWESAGSIILGDECSLAWRVMDAQYWGVAQRRRRIFLVADFGGRTASQILFEQDRLFRNTAESPRKGEGSSAAAQGSADDTGGTCLTPWDVQSRRIFEECGTWSCLCSGKSIGDGYIQTEKKSVRAFAANQRDEVRDLHDVAGAIQAQPGMKQQTFIAENCLNGWDTQQSRVFLPDGVAPTLAGADGGGGRNPAGLLLAAGFYAGAGPAAGGVGYSAEVSPTLKAAASGTNMVPAILCLNDQGGSQMSLTEDIAGTLRAQEHGHQPVLFENHPKDGRYNGPLGVAPTLAARMGTGGNNVPLVGAPRTALQETICIAGNAIDREPQNGGNGLGCQMDLAYTLTGTDRHAVYSRQRSDEFSEDDVAATQSARQHKDATDLVCQPYQETVGTIGCSDHKGVNNQYVSEDKCIVVRRKLIRRLTPTECERLQGYPDGWTDIPGASDSARYKALGNSVAIPCVDFVLRGIAFVLREAMEKQ